MNGRYKWTVWEKYPYTDTQLGKYHWRNIQNAGLREWNNFWGFRFNRVLQKGKQAIFSAVALYGTVTHNSTLGNKYLWWFISFQSGAANQWHILLVKYIKSGNTQISWLFLEKKQNICNLYEFPSFLCLCLLKLDTEGENVLTGITPTSIFNRHRGQNMELLDFVTL